MTDWHAYQSEAAKFLRSLGFDVVVDEKLQGVRARHDVDVVARGQRAGLDLLWIVECKHWNRRVSKDRVMTLRALTEDVGADKGILLAENGFQAGALAVARGTNLQLTSLAQLKEASSEEFLDLRIQSMMSELGNLSDVLFALNDVSEKEVNGLQVSTSTPKPGFDLGDWRHGQTRLWGQLAILEAGLKKAARRRFPVVYGWDVNAATETPLRADTAAELLDGATTVLSAIRAAITFARDQVASAERQGIGS